MTTPTYLFDISAYLHRAMYVTYGADRLTSVPENDESFIRHACMMLAATVRGLKVERMVVVRDSSEPSLRCDEFSAYKAERKPHPPVFRAQVPRFFEALMNVSVHVAEVPRYEADDLIATFVSHSGDGPFVIVSSDKDLMAHIDADRGTRFYDPMKASWITPGHVVEKFGVEPSQLFDYTGLVGDPSDGIPGVDGIGAKTAAKILREFDSLDEVYDPARSMALAEFCSKKQFASLMANRESAFLSRRLASPWFCKSLHAPTAENAAAPDSKIIESAISTLSAI